MDFNESRHADSRTGLSQPAGAKATRRPPQNQMNQSCQVRFPPGLFTFAPGKIIPSLQGKPGSRFPMLRFNQFMVCIHKKIDFAASLFAVCDRENRPDRPTPEAVAP